LLAAIFYRALVPTTSHRWRNSFWFGPSPPILIIIFCLMLPETYYFQVTKAKREARHKDNVLAAEGTESRSNSLRAFWRESSKVLKQNWVLLIYMVVLRTGFDSCLHGSQDIYPTFLKDTVRMSATKTKVITVVGQTGAVLGGTTIGYLNSVTGRRLTMMCTAVAGAAIVPAYVLPRDLSHIANVFFEQFFVGESGARSQST
ncbi:hypothetical protein LTR66_008458, partial [Elasticomyces elasticus]